MKARRYHPRAPRVGEFVIIWLMDHSALAETVPIITAGIVSSLTKEQMALDYWSIRSEGAENEWPGAIDRRTIERCEVIDLPIVPGFEALRTRGKARRPKGKDKEQEQEAEVSS